mgnify:CR=1 FL=1
MAPGPVARQCNAMRSPTASVAFAVAGGVGLAVFATSSRPVDTVSVMVARDGAVLAAFAVWMAVMVLLGALLVRRSVALVPAAAVRVAADLLALAVAVAAALVVAWPYRYTVPGARQNAVNRRHVAATAVFFAAVVLLLALAVAAGAGIARAPRAIAAAAVAVAAAAALALAVGPRSYFWAEYIAIAAIILAAALIGTAAPNPQTPAYAVL